MFAAQKPVGAILVLSLGLSAALLAATPPSKKAKVKNTAVAKSTAAKHAAAGRAQAPTASNSDFEASRMQGSLLGTPGLWATQVAETLLPGQVSSGAYVQRYSRTPGGLVFTDAQMGWTVGLTNRLELSFATTPYRRIRLTHPEQLTFGPSGTLGSFDPAAPFARNPLITGPVDWTLGATFGLLSQDRGDPIGLALQAGESVPYTPTYANGVDNYGVSTTEPAFFTNVLLDKWIGTGGEMIGNFGYRHNGTADAGGRVSVPLRDQFTYGFGEIFPLQSRLQGIVELNGAAPFGAGGPTAVAPALGSLSPLDLTGGIRFNPLTWMGINAGYRFAAHSPTANASGFVFGLSFGPPPVEAAPAPPPAPTLACRVDQSVVQPGTTVNITSSATPGDETFTYGWTTTGGQLAPNGATATLDTTALAPGMYTVTGRVTNPAGETADCSVNVEVRVPPQHPPTASCSVDPQSVLPGAGMAFHVDASSPDNRPLTYAWTLSRSDAGQLDSTSNATVHLDTTGATPGAVRGSVTVKDDRGLTAGCYADGTIETPPPPPQPSLATTLSFAPNSARVNNISKRALDAVALQLEQDASAQAVIVGYATSTEVQHRRPLTAAATVRLAEERAVNTMTYLVKDKGIAADRITLRHGDGPQKAEVWIVPQGATYRGGGVEFQASDVNGH